MSQCIATSKAKGKRCGREAIPGGTVCRYHGGAAPQVQKAARLRLAALVDPAINQLQKLLKSKSEPISLAAVRDVLDRAGYKATDKVAVTGADGGPIKAEMTVKFVKS